MRIRAIGFAGLAMLALALPAVADEVRVGTTAEKQRVSDALAKDGYQMVDQVRVDNDKVKAFAKTKEGQNVEVTLDLATLKVLNVEKK
jgi:hypothetical protein